MSQAYDPCHRRKYHSPYGALLGYGCISEEANIKLVELVGDYFIMYGFKDPDYTRKDKIGPVWENIWKGLNESRKTLFHISVYL